MYPDLASRVTLFRLLHRIDLDLAQAYQAERCPHCGGRLDRAPYVRKPRGGPVTIPEEYEVRQSLCCSRAGCRKRRLPPSCLFWGRRVYWGPVLILVVTLRQQQPESHSANRLRQRFGVSRQTLVRWMAYFREVFPSSSWWQRLRGRVSPVVRHDRLPSSLLEVIVDVVGSAEQALVNGLCFLAAGQADPPCRSGWVGVDRLHAKDGGIR